MVENNSKNSILQKTLEKIIFNEKEFEELKLIINKLGNGNPNIQQLKKKIINSRIRMLKDVSNFLSFHLKQQPNPSKEKKTSEFEHELREKNDFLTLLAQKIENFYQNLKSD